MNKIIRLLLCLVLVLACTGCVKGNVSKQKTILKIMVESSAQQVESYGRKSFIDQHPEMTVQWIHLADLQTNPLDAKELEKVIKEQQPDVFIGSLNYDFLARNGYLLDLNTTEKNRKLSLTKVYEPVLQSLKDHGGSGLYGVAPVFNREALFYNETLFEENAISVPEDHMSWKDILDLAQRFPHERNNAALYGFHDGNRGLLDVIDLVGKTEGLVTYAGDQGRLTIASEKWKQVYETVLPALQSGSVYILPNHPKQSETGEQLFLNGQIAMIRGNDALFRQLSAMKLPFTWHMATQPESTQYANEGSLAVPFVYSVAKDAQNPAGALAYVESATTGEASHLLADNGFGLSVYAEYRSDQVDVFTRQNYRAEDSFPLTSESMDFLSKVSLLRQKELQLVIDHKATLDQAFAEMDKEGQSILDAYDAGR